MLLIRRTLARGWHRIALAYRLACVRQDIRCLGLRVPSGVWSRKHCHLVLWDLDTFVVHSRAHAT
jgi:hypothetical protein